MIHSTDGAGEGRNGRARSERRRAGVATTKGVIGMFRSPRRFARKAPRALAVPCMVLFCVLTVAGVAHAQTACPPGVQCGAVPVPLDRANPAAGTIDVAYAFVPHSDRSRPSLGTIAPTRGAPGGSASGLAGVYLKASAALRARRDLLLIDMR